MDEDQGYAMPETLAPGGAIGGIGCGDKSTGGYSGFSTIWKEVEVVIRLSTNKLTIPVTTQGIMSSQQKHPGVCVNIIVALALSHHVPVAKRARKGTLLEEEKEATKKFGPLKVVLGTIPAIFANRQVRFQSPSSNSPEQSAFNRDLPLREKR